VRTYAQLLARYCEAHLCERRGLLWRLPARTGVVACSYDHARQIADELLRQEMALRAERERWQAGHDDRKEPNQ
jgi:hypothetical protein